MTDAESGMLVCGEHGQSETPAVEVEVDPERLSIELSGACFFVFVAALILGFVCLSALEFIWTYLRPHISVVTGFDLGIGEHLAPLMATLVLMVAMLLRGHPRSSLHVPWDNWILVSCMVVTSLSFIVSHLMDDSLTEVWMASTIGGLAGMLVCVVAWVWRSLRVAHEHAAWFVIALLSLTVSFKAIQDYLWSHVGWIVLSWVSWAVGFVTKRDCFFVEENFTVTFNHQSIIIEPPCSGFSGILLSACILVAYWVILSDCRRWRTKILIVVFSMTLMWLLNSIRITILLLMLGYGDPDFAVQTFHSRAGWVFVLLTVVSSIWLYQVALTERFFNEWSETKTIGLQGLILPCLTGVAVGFIGGMLASTHSEGFWASVIGLSLGGLLYLLTGSSHLETKTQSLCVSIVGGLGLGMLAYGLWILGGGSREVELESMTAAVLIVRLMVYILLTSVVEELFFREYLCRRIHSARVYLLISTGSFGLLHEQVVPAILAGAVFALAMLLARDIRVPVIAHCTTNALLCL